MSKTKISIATIGHIPAEFNRQKIKDWQSSIFELVGEIESYALNNDSDGDDWQYTDKLLETDVPKTFSGEFFIAIVNVPLQHNWYSRRLSGNRVVFTFHEIKEYLRFSNIPLENVVFRLLYAYTLYYKRCGNQILTTASHINFTHDETRGCLFDMNGIKFDIVYSCHNPILCSVCLERLRKDKVSDETISKCVRDIRRIRKTLFYRITDFIKKYPVWSLIISGITAIALGTIGSVIASFIYETIK